MSTDPHSALPRVDINGKKFEHPAEGALMEVTVDTDLTAVDSCEITILDATRVALKGIQFGNAVKISVPKTGRNKELLQLFEGEVYGTEFEADERGTYTRITAYDKSFRLKQHRVTEAYVSMTDSDIAKKIAKSVGLPLGKVDRSPIVHKHMGQVNQTHWDFLHERAVAIGFDLFIQKGKLNFCKPTKASTGPKPAGHTSANPLQLTPGKNLIHLRTRTSGVEKVAEVVVRGWDPAQKKELTSTAKAKTTSTKLSRDPERAANAVGGPARVTGRPDLSTQADCDALAKSLAERTAATVAYAEGTAFGNPEMTAGTVVSIGEIGNFDGKYLLTRARHILRPGDYRTVFTVSGSHDRSRFGLQATEERNEYPGTYPAIISNLKDPDKQGRVKMTFPWLDKKYESDWARVMQIGAGAGEGFLWYPEVGDEVLVSFLGGDPRKPTVIGGLHNGKDKPPFADHISNNGEVEVRGMKSKSGHVVTFHDKRGEERIEIVTGKGSCTIVLNEKSKEIVIESKGDITVKATKNVDVQASGDVNVKASKNLKIEATANAEIKAGANLKLEAGAVVEIKGALVKLN